MMHILNCIISVNFSYCALGQYAKALAVIELRNLPYAWLGSIYVAVKANDLSKAEAIGLQYLEHSMSKGNYTECVKLIKENEFLQVRDKR